MKLILLPDTYAICRLGPKEPIPDWATGCFVSTTRTSDELCVVCRDDLPPPCVRAERHWRCLRVDGVLEFSETGILASFAAPLAAAGISIFVLSTYDTDYMLVRSDQLPDTIMTVKAAGHTVSGTE